MCTHHLLPPLPPPTTQRNCEPRPSRNPVFPQPRLDKRKYGPLASCRQPVASCTPAPTPLVKLRAPLESLPLFLAVVAAPANETMTLARLSTHDLLPPLPSPSKQIYESRLCHHLPLSPPFRLHAFFRSRISWSSCSPNWFFHPPSLLV